MADRIKGITIELNGDTTKLSKALDGVNKEVKSTQTALKDVDKLLKLDPKNTELLRQKQKLLADQIGNTKDKLEQLKSAQASMDASGVDKSSADYMALRREIIDCEDSLGRLEKAAEKSNVAMQKVAAVSKSIGDGAQKVADKTKALSAAAGGLLAGLGAAAYGAVTAADDLNTLAKQSGFTTGELQKMQYAADRVDVSMEDITGAAKKLKSNMQTAADAFVADHKAMENAMESARKKAEAEAEKQKRSIEGIREAGAVAAKKTKEEWEGSSNAVAKAFTRLKVSIKDADGNMRDATDVFWDAVTALSAVENETERDQIAMDLFGKSADQLAGIIDDGGAAFRELGDEAERAGLIMEQDTLDSLNEVNDAIDKVKATAKATLTETGAKAIQASLPAIEKIIDAIGKVLEFIGNLNEEQISMIVNILAIVAAISPVASIIAKIAAAVGALLPIFPVIGGTLEGLWILISEVIAPAIMSGISGIISFIGSTVIPAIGSLFAFIAANPIILVIAAITAAVVALGVYLYKHWDEVKARAAELGQALSAMGSATMDAIRNGAKKLGNDLKLIWDSIGQALKMQWDAWAGLGNAIIGGIKSAISSVVSWVQSAVNSVINSINAVISAVRSLFGMGGSVSVGTTRVGKMAAGGTLRHGMSLVGENGPELLTVSGGQAVVQPLNATVDSKSLASAMGGIVGGGTTNVNVSFTGSLAQLAAVLQPVIVAETNRRGGSFVNA